MRILLLHNRYVSPGGEDAVVEAETALLRSRGHEVAELAASNVDALSTGRMAAVKVLLASSWNRTSYRRVRQAIREFRPDIVHVHNFWFTLSPSVFAAAKDEGVLTVMTLHNYRLICPGALLMRRGRPCEVCVGRSPWRSVPRRCYRGSFLQTALVARMVTYNQLRGTWPNLVDAYIALTEFSRNRFVAGGLPADRIFVKPNFVEDPLVRSVNCRPQAAAQDLGSPASSLRPAVIFVGRLSAEKGLRTLADAWRLLRESRKLQATGHLPHSLTIVGDGPERRALMAMMAGAPDVVFTGRIGPAEVLARIRQSACLVLPSKCYETFGRCIVEAYACARPVIASRLDSMAELVKDGDTGLLFEPGNARDLATKIDYLLETPPELERMGRNARAEFEAKYTDEKNYEQLMDIYGRIRARAGG